MQSDYSAIAPALVGFFAIYLISKWFGAATYKLKHIPTIGSSGIIYSYFDAFKFFQHGHETIQEGYNKYYGSAFKVARIGGWLVLVSGPQMIEDIRRATEDQISFDEALADHIQTDYTLGRPIRVDTYHNDIVQKALTRNISAKLSDINDEIDASFRELIPVEEYKWTKVPASATVVQIVCRIANRYFVGLPLCRNPEYRKLNEKFTIEVFQAAQFINMFPKILRTLVGRLLTKVQASIKRASFHIRPLMEAQLEQERLHGPDWPDKPNNFITWLMDKARDQPRPMAELILRVLVVNFAAIHTTSNTFTHVLYDLATYQEYVSPMREEVEAIIQTEGWTKSSLGKMHKLDSFIRESQRTTMESVGVNRKIMKDFTFSNGITLPAGTEISVVARATHLDERNYENPHKFQGFRFSEMRAKEGYGASNQIVSLSSEILTFGAGRHACPGRFLAANILKSMLVYVLLNYDVKLAQEGPRPESFWFQARESPNQTAEVMFRKRSAKSP